MPNDLRYQASREIREVWGYLKPNAEHLSPEEIVANAFQVARDARIRYRRVQDCPHLRGVFSLPLNWADLMSWFDAGDGHEVRDFGS